MIRRDYILHLVEATVAALCRVLGHKQAGNYPAALADVRRTASELLGLEEKAWLALSDRQLARLLTADGRLHRERCAVAAVLLKEEAALLNLLGETECARRQQIKALSLLLDVTTHGVNVPGIDCAAEIAALRDCLSDSDLPAHVESGLLQHHELRGEFAEAENVLFRLAETRGPEMFAAGSAFYQRLLAQPDDALERGNLPRAEVESGLLEFRARHSPASARG